MLNYSGAGKSDTAGMAGVAHVSTTTNAAPETVACRAEQALGPGPVSLQQQLHTVYHLPVYQ